MFSFNDINVIIIWNVKRRCKKDEADAIVTKRNIQEAAIPDQRPMPI